MQEIPSGKWCTFQVLTQDGPLCKKVCQVTTELIRLADMCFEKESVNKLGKAFPPGSVVGNRLGAVTGGELHKVLYEMAVRAREAGALEPRLKVTRPVNKAIDSNYTRKGERSAAGPDFVLSGTFDGEDVHAAWDFTTSEALASHYDRDVLGRTRKQKLEQREQPHDPEIQQVSDTVNYWTSYVAIIY